MNDGAAKKSLRLSFLEASIIKICKNKVFSQ